MKKYLLTYHKHRDLLYPIVINLTLDIENKFKSLPPLSITNDEIINCEKNLQKLIRKIAGFHYYVALQTIKEGFGIDNFFSIYNKEEREELANFVYEQQKEYFEDFIKNTIIEGCKEQPKLLNKFVEQKMIDFTKVFTFYNKEVFLTAFVFKAEKQVERLNPIIY